MSEALLAAMKLRKQQADEARYREEQRVLLESGAGPTTMPISGEQTSPWPIIGDAAMNDAAAYGEQVGEAFSAENSRAQKGFNDLLLGGDKALLENPMGAVNQFADRMYGSLNSAFSPLAPPLEAALKPALESETGQGFVSGLSALGDEIEATTGLSKQNQLDTLMWGAPFLPVKAAAKAAIKPVAKAVAPVTKRIGEAADRFNKAVQPKTTPELSVEAFDNPTRVPAQEGMNISPLAELDGAVQRGVDYYSKVGRDQVLRDEIKGNPYPKVEPRGPIQSRDALTEDPKGSALRTIKVNPGESIWDVMQREQGSIKEPFQVADKFRDPRTVVQPKTFQAGDDFLRLNKNKEEPKKLAKEYLGAANGDPRIAAAILKEERSVYDHATYQGALKELQGLNDAMKAQMTGQMSPDQQAMINAKKGIPGEPPPLSGSNAGRSVPPAITVMPEGTMYGDSSGYINMKIATNPSPKDIKAAIEGSRWKEARFLIEEDGAMHFWPADGAYHNDVADFLGFDGSDAFHGVLSKRDYDAAIANGAKSLEDVARFSQGAYLEEFLDTYEMRARPEWQAADQALADSYAPKKSGLAKKVEDWFFKKPEEQAKETVKFNSPLDELDNAPVGQDQPSLPLSWKDRRADKATAQLDDQRNQRMPRGKDEPLISARGYTERQAKMVGDSKTREVVSYRSPIEELDNPRPQDAVIAASRARADELFAYKKDQPAATKPEAVPEIKAKTREVWLDPERPVLQPKPVAEQLSEMPKGRWAKRIEEAKAKVGEAFVAARAKAFPKNEDAVLTTTNLAAKTNKALDEHISMSPEQRAVNYAAAKEALRPYIGSKDGKGIYNFLGANAKLRKNSEGYAGGEPITLPNGQGVESTGMTLSAFYQKKGFNTCPRGQPCKDACLSETSGANFRYDSPGIFQEKKTNAIFDAPEAAAVALFENIMEARAKAARNGNVLTVRLNVLSDLDPKIWKPIIEHFDDVLFVDYTKMKYEPLAPNQHYTYSSTGASNDKVSSLYANWDQSKARLDRGDNVAMAFSTKKSWPKWVVDEETGKRYRVVDGVSHDFRVIDLQDANREGVIVGLKNMDETSRDMSYNKKDKDGRPMSWEEDASTTSGGFMVRYDPAKDGDTAYIPIQNSAKRSRLERNKTGPQTQIKVGGEDRTPVQNREVKTAEEINDYGDSDYEPVPDKPYLSRPKRTQTPYQKHDNARKRAAKKAEEQQKQDVVDRMFARLHMQDRAPRYDKNQPRKTFEEEYPEGWQSALAHPDLWPFGKKVEVDIDGHPIDPNALVFGRQQVGGSDKNQSPRRIREMAEALMKAKNEKAAVNDVPLYAKDGGPSTTMGSFNFSKGMKTGDVIPEGININKLGPEWLRDQTLAHEVGHAIDYLGSNKAKNVEHVHQLNGKIAYPGNDGTGKTNAGAFPRRSDIDPKLEAEFRDLYMEVNENFGLYPEGPLKGRPKSPERTGYPEHFAQSELIAEAFRLYQMDPGYIKARFPNVATYLRKITRENPDVAKFVHFNEVGGGLAAVMAAKYLAEQKEKNGER